LTADDVRWADVANSEGHRTAHEFVKESLRRAILRGDLSGGERLIQADLATMLNVSTTPVREALRDLATEGLITLDRHRGGVVREPDWAEIGDADALILPEVLGDPSSWQLQTAIHYQSHRGPGQASFIIFVKRRILMPMFRWLFEYSRDNFERQRRVNQVLFACVQELAAETARLRQQIQQQSASAPAATTDRLRT